MKKKLLFTLSVTIALVVTGCSTADKVTYPVGRFKPINDVNFIPPNVEIYKRKQQEAPKVNTTQAHKKAKLEKVVGDIQKQITAVESEINELEKDITELEYEYYYEKAEEAKADETTPTLKDKLKVEIENDLNLSFN